MQSGEGLFGLLEAGALEFGEGKSLYAGARRRSEERRGKQDPQTGSDVMARDATKRRRQTLELAGQADQRTLRSKDMCNGLASRPKVTDGGSRWFITTVTDPQLNTTKKNKHLVSCEWLTTL